VSKCETSVRPQHRNMMCTCLFAGGTKFKLYIASGQQSGGKRCDKRLYRSHLRNITTRSLRQKCEATFSLKRLLPRITQETLPLLAMAILMDVRRFQWQSFDKQIVTQPAPGNTRGQQKRFSAGPRNSTAHSNSVPFAVSLHQTAVRVAEATAAMPKRCGSGCFAPCDTTSTSVAGAAIGRRKRAPE